MSTALALDTRARRLFGVMPAPVPPFASADDAVVWMIQALKARGEGQPAQPGPCEPDVIAKAIDRLYRQRTIHLCHARILRIWGERGRAPDATFNRADRRLWDEAMRGLDAPLRLRGIVR